MSGSFQPPGRESFHSPWLTLHVDEHEIYHHTINIHIQDSSYNRGPLVAVAVDAPAVAKGVSNGGIPRVPSAQREVDWATSLFNLILRYD
jgi:hypothetical protein